MINISLPEKRTPDLQNTMIPRNNNIIILTNYSEYCSLSDVKQTSYIQKMSERGQYWSRSKKRHYGCNGG